MNKSSTLSELLCRAYLVKALLLFRMRISQYNMCIFESANILQIHICDYTTEKFFSLRVRRPDFLLSIYIH